MINTAILSWVTFIYFAAFVFYLFRMILGREFWGKLATGVALAGLVAQSVALIIRWKTSYDLGMGHAPLSNFYESLIFFAWTIVLLYLLMERRLKNRSIGVFVLPVAFLIMAYASIAPGINNRIEPLIPALQSNWLTSHVLTCFMGYAAFTVAFALGMMFFVKTSAGGDLSKASVFIRLLPSEYQMDELMYSSAALGFIFLTLGIVTGSVWAHYAWGSYWSWDPKETWSLITWLTYAVMLHARLVRGWRGKRMAIMAIVGFGCVLFTYLGVNLLPSLHSYMT
ncbi:MAG: c-type cytochrome biogenesis protein CcsB [Smithellaceae bacterium]|jgi:cytochrome c-type biogenesis protein CcsB|nr:c-type cytochrome biogenesis protein CcsB [Smithellaceae bacterium]MDD5414335.1 c-type cytochrome biogenesis protein CcsB [Smithellaceae bacterium]HBJ74344.1 c-type cytochrome biogenesis protein CcsB [Syntrophaceae bacterium]HCS77408.1 c-type cytochrome biogenesis protein CcsB [Syntrophaceae bacterium]HCX02626.1 c-type cytochrome biogenesis protein CcsB [Syntrophaceae bacterium]